MRKVLAIIADVVIVLILFCTIACTISTINNGYTSFFNYSLVTVQSNSMSKSNIYKGDIYLIVDADTYEMGDIIAFEANNMIWFHEIVDIDADTGAYITKGSSNNTTDGSQGVLQQAVFGKRCCSLNLKLLSNKIIKCILIIIIYLILMLQLLFSALKIINEEVSEPQSQNKSRKNKSAVLFILMSFILLNNYCLMVFSISGEVNTATVLTSISFTANKASQYITYTSNGTVSGYDNSSGETHIIIPAINNDGKTVTEVANGVFNGNNSVELIDIPATVTTIGHLNFLFCNNLRTIVIRADTPPSWTSWFGLQLGNDVTIYVPDASVNIYKKADGWSRFRNQIKPLSEYVES